MEKTREELREIIQGVLKKDNSYIYELQVHFIGAMRKTYHDYIGSKFGNSDEDDVINVSLHRIVNSIHMFNGNTWKQFESYVFTIITNTTINYRRTLIRKANVKHSSYDYEELHDHIEYTNHNITESLENKVVNNMLYRHIIETSNLSKREQEYKKAIARHGSIENYLRENEGNAKALNQAGYRLRNKLQKRMRELGITLG